MASNSHFGPVSPLNSQPQTPTSRKVGLSLPGSPLSPLKIRKMAPADAFFPSSPAAPQPSPLAGLYSPFAPTFSPAASPRFENDAARAPQCLNGGPEAAQPEPSKSPQTGAQVHQLISDAGKDLVTALGLRGKKEGRLVAVAAGLGTAGGVAVISLAAAHVLAAIILFPPIVVGIILVPLLAGLFGGMYVRARSRQNFRNNPACAQKIATLKEIQNKYANIDQPSAVETQIAAHARAVLKKLDTYGVVARDAGELGSLSAVVGIFGAAIGSLFGAFSQSGGGNGAKVEPNFAETNRYYGMPKFSLSGSKARQVKLAQRNTIAAERPRLDLALTPDAIGALSQKLSKNA
jgi:hypothetical protein